MKLGLIKHRSPGLDTPGPGVWIGASHRVAGPDHELVETPEGDAVEAVPPQYLVALWKPLRRNELLLRRFPTLATLVSLEEAQVVDAMRRHVPDGKRLCVLPLDVDWALIAQIVMITDDHLSARQHQILQAFIDDERRRTLLTIGTSYQHDAKGLQRFVDTEPGGLTE